MLDQILSFYKILLSISIEFDSWFILLFILGITLIASLILFPLFYLIIVLITKKHAPIFDKDLQITLAFLITSIPSLGFSIYGAIASYGISSYTHFDNFIVSIPLIIYSIIFLLIQYRFIINFLDAKKTALTSVEDDSHNRLSNVQQNRKND